MPRRCGKTVSIVRLLGGYLRTIRRELYFSMRAVDEYPSFCSFYTPAKPILIPSYFSLIQSVKYQVVPIFHTPNNRPDIKMYTYNYYRERISL